MSAVLDEIKRDAEALKARFHLRRMGIFGSYARGEQTPQSDIDMLVEFDPGYETFDNYMDMKHYLEDRFGRKVDLVTADALKPQIREGILAEVSYA